MERKIPWKRHQVEKEESEETFYGTQLSQRPGAALATVSGQIGPHSIGIEHHSVEKGRKRIG
jgi:hypothetical protein